MAQPDVSCQPQSHRRAGKPTSNTRHLLRPRIRRGRWPHFLRSRPKRSISPQRDARGKDPQGRKAVRLAGRATERLRVACECANSEGRRHRNSIVDPATRGYGDRMSIVEGDAEMPTIEDKVAGIPDTVPPDESWQLSS